MRKLLIVDDESNALLGIGYYFRRAGYEVHCAREREEDCRPDYFKVDRYVVQGCHADPYRQAVIESIGLLGSEVAARIVAEGVEDPRDLDELQLRGIALFQGDLLAPARAARDWSPERHPCP